MEKQSPRSNVNAVEPEQDHTVVIADDVSGGDDSSLLESLPLKPQGRYKFIRSIGFGGMKGVLLVHDRDTDRDVAMAIMPDFRDRPVRDLNRFVREAKITAKCSAYLFISQCGYLANSIGIISLIICKRQLFVVSTKCLYLGVS